MRHSRLPAVRELQCRVWGQGWAVDLRVFKGWVAGRRDKLIWKEVILMVERTLIRLLRQQIIIIGWCRPMSLMSSRSMKIRNRGRILRLRVESILVLPSRTIRTQHRDSRHITSLKSRWRHTNKLLITMKTTMWTVSLCRLPSQVNKESLIIRINLMSKVMARLNRMRIISLPKRVKLISHKCSSLLGKELLVPTILSLKLLMYSNRI